MTKRIITISVLVVAAAISRLLPHAPNFTPIGAMALFAGAYVSNRYLATLMPLLAMLLSDAIMGFRGWFFVEQVASVYLSLGLIALIGSALQKNKNIWRVGGASLASSVLFFIMTNFATWLSGFSHEPAMYSLNGAGLAQCYVAAIPFFGNTITGDLFYSAILFGGFYLLQVNIPSLKEEKVRA